MSPFIITVTEWKKSVLDYVNLILTENSGVAASYPSTDFCVEA